MSNRHHERGRPVDVGRTPVPKRFGPARVGIAVLWLVGALVHSEAAAAPSVVGPPSVSTATQPAPLDVRSKQEARRRFDRGLALYNEGDPVGALAEFRVAYRITSHPIVLYNIALVHAKLGDAARAVEALEKLQTGSLVALGPERAAHAQQVYREQLLRVGTLEVKTDVQRAAIVLDGVDVATTPAPPLRVTAGTHLLSVLAPKYEPRRLQVTVAGGAVESVEVTLTPLEEALAHLTLTTSVSDVEVRASGQLLGKTPFAAQLAFAPGSYDLEFQRPGYATQKRQVRLDPGSSGTMQVHMPISAEGLGSESGLLVVEASEPNAVVSVDGQPLTQHASGLRLPLGPHRLRVQRAGFFDVEREVLLGRGTHRLDVTLLPTAGYLDNYVRRTQAMRTWSWISLGAGTLIAGAGGAFLIWNQGEKNEAERQFDELEAKVLELPDQKCGSGPCEDDLWRLAGEYDKKAGRDVYGWLAVGVGGAALATGVMLRLLGDDPSRFDPKPESDIFGALRLRLQPGFVGVTRSF